MKASEKQHRGHQFLLTETLPELRMLMRKPNYHLRVVVLDDDETAVAGIVKILAYWPNIFPDVNAQKSDIYPDIRQSEDDIVLLDEKMGNLTGTKMMEWLRQDGFTGVIASIKSGDVCPPAFLYHFPDKNFVMRSLKTANKFIIFMNSLIVLAERNKAKYEQSHRPGRTQQEKI